MRFDEFPVYSVSQLNGYLKELMDSDGLLQGVLVRGEISNYKCYPSGHHYFSLKDRDAALRCVLFRGDAVRLRFRPANGTQVVAFGRVSVYPRDGQYQLYCTELFEDGRGALDEAFERLRRKLEAEGLFDPSRKKKLPAFPKKIALVTSPAGAAVRDMIRVLGARWPLAEVMVVPVRVQGAGAAEEIAAAIRAVNGRGDADLIITGRGGGSKEDLWAFNEEAVARAVSSSAVPVISAVGHEPDVSISDYAADLRAATPSNAAELAVPDRDELRARLESLARRLARAEGERLSAARRELARLKGSRALAGMRGPIQERRMQTDALRRRLAAALTGSLKDRRGALSRLSAGLDAMSPLKVLARGYAIVRMGGAAVTRQEQVGIGDRVDVALSDGVLSCEVREKEARSWR